MANTTTDLISDEVTMALESALSNPVNFQPLCLARIFSQWPVKKQADFLNILANIKNGQPSSSDYIDELSYLLTEKAQEMLLSLYDEIATRNECCPGSHKTEFNRCSKCHEHM